MITYGQRTISYAEMDERSSRVARALAAEGVAAQDRVAFLDKNGPEYFEVLFGGGKINAVNVAVNWRLAPAEMEYTINDAEAKVLFVGRRLPSRTWRRSRARLRDGEEDRGARRASAATKGYGGWLGRQRPEDPGSDVGAGRRRDAALHLGHHRPAQGRHAHERESRHHPAARRRLRGASTRAR